MLAGRRRIVFNCFVFVFAIAAGSSSLLQAQLPESVLYLCDIQLNGKKVQITGIQMASGMRMNAYHNQPRFVDDERYLWSSDLDKKGRVSMYEANLARSEFKHVGTPLYSDYSPQMSQDGRHIFSICVDDSGNQYICETERTSLKRQIFRADLTNIGYFREVGRDTFLVFRVGEPHEWWRISSDKQADTLLSRDIGRCFEHWEGDNYLYVRKLSKDHWTLRTMDVRSGRSYYLADMLPDVEDFVVWNGRVFSAQHNRLYELQRTEGVRAYWALAAVIPLPDTVDVTRMAINPSGNKCLIVVSHKK